MFKRIYPVKGLLLALCLISAELSAQQVFYQSPSFGYTMTNLSGTTFTVPGNTNGQNINVKSRKINVRLDMGDVYLQGGQDWSYSLDLTFNAYNASNALLQSFPLHLTISDGYLSVNGYPQNSAYFEFTSLYPQIHHFTVSNVGYVTGGANFILAQNAIRLIIKGENDIGYGTKKSGNEIRVKNLKATGLGESILPVRFTNVKYTWELPLPLYQHFESYDLEVLKVEPDINHKVIIDWSKATRIEVENGATEYTMTMSEGTGYYVWRVRPIGSYYEGGRSNRKNYGEWNSPGSNITPIANTDLFELINHGYNWTDFSITPSLSLHLVSPGTALVNGDVFYYEQFNEAQNWFYGRTLSEGSRQSETMSFANGLNQVHQIQKRLFSKGLVIGQQTAYDFSGRPSLQSIHAPIKDKYLNYKPLFFEKQGGGIFAAQDFDSDATVYSPTNLSSNTGTLENYYSENNTGSMKDFYTPKSNNFPFARILYQPDATGRVWRQSGIGETMKLSNSSDATVNHNSTTQYSGVSQAELDRIFGNEAPLKETVYKVQQTDPNGVKNVSYIAKAGQVIATMLNNDVVLTNLEAVPGNNSFPVTDVLAPGYFAPASNMSETSTSLIVDGTGPNLVKEITLDYSITPATFQTDCGICWECDYIVEISVKNAQYATDNAKNITVRFSINPSLSFNCSSTPPGALSLATIFSDPSAYNVQLFDANGTLTTAPHTNFSQLLSNYKLILPSGTYHLYKRVYVNNNNPGTDLSYLEQHINELKAQAQGWTANANCCGPITIDVSGFDCDLPDTLDCSSQSFNTELTDLANSLFLYVQKEQGFLSDNTTPYRNYLTGGGAGLLSNSYTSFSNFKVLLENIICTGKINSNDLFACFKMYGGLLEQNIERAQHEYNTSNGLEPNTTGPNNGPVTANPDLDFLKSALACLNYSATNAVSCSDYDNTVTFNTLPSTEEMAATSAASLNSDYLYYLVYHAGQGINPNNSNTMGVHKTPFDNGQVVLLQVPQPGTSPSSLHTHRELCVKANAYPNASTAGMSEVKARAYLAAQVCNCLKSYNSNPSNADVSQQVIDACEEGCESKRTAFEVAVNNYVTEYNVNNGVLTDEEDANGGIWGANWSSVEDITLNVSGTAQDMECIVNSMVAQCINQCELTISQLSKEFINYQGTPCVCQANGGTNSNCFPSPIIGSTASYYCWEEFVKSEEYYQAIAKEQLEFKQAYQWGTNFAPKANFPGGYSDFGSLEKVNSEIIRFLNSSLNTNMLKRRGTTLATPAPYRINWFIPPITYYYKQASFPFVYVTSPGVNKKAVAVTNVIWDRGQDGDAPGDDFIREINIAVYCDGNTITPLFHWAYAPAISNPPCSYFAGTNPFGYDIQEQLVKFYFDGAGAFHAVLKPSACDPANVNSSFVCLENFVASASFDVISNGSNGQYLLLEAGEKGNLTYLFSDPVNWQGTREATANALAAAINAEVTFPDYTATVTDFTVTIYALDNAGTNPMATGSEFALVPTGTMSSSINVRNSSAPFTACATSLKDLAVLCLATASETNSRACPYGYFKTADPDMMGGYMLTNSDHRAAFGNEVKNFWNNALTKIIKYREIVSSPLYPISAFPNNTDGYVYYEKIKKILVNGKWFRASVTVAGKELNGIKEIYAIRLSFNCDNNYQEGGTTFNDNVIYNMVIKDVYNDKIYPEFTIDNSPGSFNPNAFPGAINYIFEDIKFLYSSGGTTYFDWYFDINEINVDANTWTPNFSELKLCYAAYEPSVNINLSSQDMGTSSHQSSFGTGEWSGCFENISCPICMEWVEPVINSIAGSTVIRPLTCEEQRQEYLDNQTETILEQCLNNKIQELKDNYINNCLGNITDEFSISYNLNYGHYTLYYHDRAGNLIKTVPPEGVDVLTGTSLANVKAYRIDPAGNIPVYPNHNIVTAYVYNSIKQLVEENTPDGGITKLWYNAAGQLILRQDAKQAALSNGTYSYTRYDLLGRVVEIGKITGFIPAFSDAPSNEAISQIWNNVHFPYTGPPYTTLANGTAVDEVIQTTYTLGAGVTYNGKPQQNLRNRISRIYTHKGIATYYSYDPHGNVEWLIQELPEIGKKTLRYEYDLVSGNVLKVIYHEGTKEQFIHKYSYDEDNRITEVLTSTDGLNWDTDGRYDYYKHGPLARTELGQDKLQGNDYTYTVEGYMKALNQVELSNDGSYDPGMDGADIVVIKILEGAAGNSISSITIGSMQLLTNSVPWNISGAYYTATDLVKAINANFTSNSLAFPFKASNREGSSNEVVIYKTGVIGSNDAVAVTSTIPVEFDSKISFSGFVKDEFAMELGYYDGDYNRAGTRIGGKTNNPANTSFYPFTSNLNTADKGLFNGNISYWTSNTRSGQSNAGSIDYYGIKSNLYRYDVLNRLRSSDFNQFNGNSYTLTDNRYDEVFTYDHNGNIKTLLRHGNTKGGNADVSTLVMDNLNYNYLVSSGRKINNKLLYVDDSQVQSYGTDLGDQNAENYTYDALGNLVGDISDPNSKLTINWNLFNKISSVEKRNNSGAVSEIIKFEYDGSGNRVVKRVENSIGQATETYYYVRDASGNIMTVYKKAYTNGITNLKMTEQPVYGSSRIGLHNPDLLIASTTGYVNDYRVSSESLVPQIFTKTIVKKDLTNWVASCLSNNNNSFSGIVDMNFSGGSPVVTNSISTINLHKNIAIAEDANGNLQFKAAWTSFNGNSEAFIIFGKTGLIMPGGFYPKLYGSRQTKSIVARAQDNQNIYHVITGEAGKLYFHTVDMSYGPYGEVIEKNQLIKVNGNNLTYDVTANQYALAVYNDFDNPITNKLYITVNQSNVIKLYQFDIVNYGLINPILITSYDDIERVCKLSMFDDCYHYSPRYPKLDIGEMHISPNGNEFALNLYSKGKHEIKRFSINPTTGKASFKENEFILTETRPGTANKKVRNFLNKAVYTFDYVPAGDHIYYLRKENCTGVSLVGTCQSSVLQRFNLATNTSSVNSSATVSSFNSYIPLAEMRRGKDGNLYINWQRNVVSICPSFISNKSLTVYSGNLSSTSSTLTSTNLPLNAGPNNYGLPLQPFFKQTLTFTTDSKKRKVGDKVYEITDHLGNVRATFGDKRMANVTAGVVTGSLLEVESWADYYAFGSEMPGRTFNSTSYRYGFNGKEKDDEVKGSGNSYDFGDRIYDPRIGRWLSIDKRFKDYVPYTPYGFALNNPIYLVDADGNVVVDSKGNPITVSITQAKDGSATATYKYADGTDVTDQNFLDNGGRLINTLIQIETGRELVKAANDHKDHIEIKIRADKHPDGHLGETMNLRDKEGNVIGSKILIYEGSIDKISGGDSKQAQEYKLYDLNQDQKVARTGAHELKHATNAEDLRIRKEEKRDLTPKEHEPAINTGKVAAIEFGNKNKEKKNENK